MKTLLIVDLQKEFRDSNGAYDRVLQFVREHAEQYDRILATVFSQTVNGQKNPNYQCCLQWDGCLACDESSLEFLEDIQETSYQVVVKNGYSSSELLDHLDKTSEIDVIGCDADACVMAICFTLWDAGMQFRVLSKYIYTTAKDFTCEDVLRILTRNFGICIVKSDE